MERKRWMKVDGRLVEVAFDAEPGDPSRGLGDTVAKVIHGVTLGTVTPCGGCADKRKARTWRELAAGTIGLAKSALGIDAAVDDVITARWSACMQCAENDRGVCRKCGCHLSAKVRITAERCPIGRW